MILIREPGLEGTTCPITCAPAEYHPHKGARPRRDHVSYILPVLLLSTILIREPGLEGTTCPIACAPAEYHPHKVARPRRDHVS